MSDPIVGPPSAPASPAVAEPAAYRPLSILAVVALGLAGVYTAAIVLGAAVAFFRGAPFLMSVFWVLVPVAAAVLAGMALTRIKRSEGTLAGEKAARWGLTLSILVGCGYWAYFAATYFAISREAGACGKDFLTKLGNGDEMGAFCLTLPRSERPPENDRLREALESRFNNVSQQSTQGPLGNFRHSEVVRMTALGGKGATVEPLGVESLHFAAGAYEVQLLYRVSHPAATCVVLVTVVGEEVKGTAGRQWHVAYGPDKIGMYKPDPPRLSAEGVADFTAGNSAREYITKDWMRVIGEGREEDAYQATLPPGERDASRKLPEDGLAGLVRAEPGVFWAPPDIRDEIVKLAREQFRHPNAALAGGLRPDSTAQVPVVRRQGDRLEVGWDLSLPLPAGSPRYLVEGQLVMECDAAEAASGTIKTWRVRSFDLVSGKPLPELSIQARRRMGGGM